MQFSNTLFFCAGYITLSRKRETLDVTAVPKQMANFIWFVIEMLGPEDTCTSIVQNGLVCVCVWGGGGGGLIFGVTGGLICVVKLLPLV